MVVLARNRQNFLIFLFSFTLTLIIGGVNVLSWKTNYKKSYSVYQKEYNEPINTLEMVAARIRGPLLWDDPHVLSLLQKQYLLPPDQLPYNLKEGQKDEELEYIKYKTTYPTWGFIDSILKDLYKDQVTGFFVEAGALDGEFLSNTLQLEKKGWTGLLVEASQDNYKFLLSKHRKAWSSGACLAIHPFPHIAVISGFRRNTKTADYLTRGANRIEQDVNWSELGPGYKEFQNSQCFPAASFLLALNVTSIDFFSLDVEGVEMKILNNFPFNEILVDVWAIEHTKPNSNDDNITQNDKSIVNETKSGDSWEFEDAEFVEFMESKGYYLFDMFCHPIPDYVFIRRESNIFKSFEVPENVWKRKGICFDKPHTFNDIWTTFRENGHRDKRHWPSLKYTTK